MVATSLAMDLFYVFLKVSCMQFVWALEDGFSMQVSVNWLSNTQGQNFNDATILSIASWLATTAQLVYAFL